MYSVAYYIGAFAFIVWILAVYKVYISDISINSNAKSLSENQPSKLGNENSHQNFESVDKFVHFSSAADIDNNHQRVSSGIVGDNKVPMSSEWIFVRSNPKYKVESSSAFDHGLTSPKLQIVENEVVNLVQSNIDIVSPHQQLSWPPTLSDGTIPIADGKDKMPLIGIEVPRFWAPSEGTDLNTAGSKVNGEETIFLMIASYRDFQCHETITSAFLRADHPERLFVAAVDQTVPGDVGCLDIEVPCSQDSSQPICKYRDQISIYHMDAQFATGPVTARHVGDRMYRGEYFAMQMDAHCLFVRHWDSKIIEQWRSTHNEMAVLSSYLTDVQGSLSESFDSTRHTRPIMCNSDFEGAMPARYLRHGAQPEDVPEVHDMPQMQPFWAAGFSFSRGHFKVRVPYDAYQPMVFQGEEIGIGIRGFTWGYDFYAPRDSVVFHEYAVKSSRRNKVHMFWENSAHAGEGQKSLRRGTSVIGMAPDIDPATWDHSEIDKYGLGAVRELSLFYKLFLIDVKQRKATQLCPFVKSGLMHNVFQPHLRLDGLGIDYSQLADFDTAKAIENHMLKQHPYWEKFIRAALETRNTKGLNDAINSADRIGLSKKQPELIAKAKQLLSQHS